MSFMMQIEAAQRPPLDMLAADYFTMRSAQPSIEFCRRVVGVPESDEVVARRLGVCLSTVRGWREIGRRANPSGSCQR